MATEKKLILNIDTGQSIKSVSELRSYIKQLKDQMVGLDEGSAEFQKLANAVGEATHQMQAINQAARGFSTDFGDMLGNISGAAAGLVGGLQAVSAAVNLFGGESELAQEAMLKLQQSMAIVQGLSAIDAGIKSFKKLIPVIKAATAAMRSFAMSNPFTAIIAGATALVGIVVGITKAFDNSTKEAQKFGREAANSLSQIGKNNEILDFEIQMLKATGATTEEIYEQTRAIRLQNLAIAQATKDKLWDKWTNASGKAREELEKQLDEATAAEQKAYNEWKSFVNDTIRQEAEQRTQARIKSIENAKKAAAQRIKIADDEYNHKKALMDQTFEMELMEIDPKDQKSIYERTKKYYEDLEALQIEYRDKISKRKKTAEYDPTSDLDAMNTALISTRKELVKLNTEWERNRSEAEKAALQASVNAQISETNIVNQRELTELQHEHNLALREGTLTEAQLLAMDKERLQLQLEQFDGRYEELQMKLDSELMSQIEYNEALANLQNEQLLLEDEIAQKSIDIEKAKVAAKLEEQKKLIDGYTQVADSVGDTLSSVASMMDEESEGYRALMITQTIISMLSGSVKAFTAAMDLGMPMGAIVGAAQSAAIIANGVATIAKMKTANENTSISASSLNIASATPITPTYMSGSYQQNEKVDTRVYVLESDITNVQRSVRTGVRESTF